jgi:hypothetical protein
LLANQPNLFDKEQIIGWSQSEGSDFGRPSVTQEQKFGPSRRAKS